MHNRPSQDAIEGLYQDLGSICSEINQELGNGDLEITDDNANEWFAMHHRLFALYDELASLKRKSGPMPKVPIAEHIPIYGVTNGRGRIIL